MKRGTVGKRVGLAAACLASAAGMALVPAQPASAAMCESQARVPSMIDHKLMLVNGTNKAVCNGLGTIVSEVELQRYFFSASEWRIVGTGKRTETKAEYAVADAFFDCAGQGPEVHFRSSGKGMFWPEGMGGNQYQDSDVSASREIRCGDSSLPLIRP